MPNACVIFEADLMSYMDIFFHVAAYRFDELDEYATRLYQQDVCIESGRTIEVYRRKGGPGG